VEIALSHIDRSTATIHESESAGKWYEDTLTLIKRAQTCTFRADDVTATDNINVDDQFFGDEVQEMDALDFNI
jgi:hypothetical protein